eukprot:TRINITY_DN3614_c0_g1_i1.p1 TRINITY_DN3614_c0_g1~~TRINITY_DN3614_c0_g1_i1.p1  ORF type:complete len:275 (+),score=52.63 TRINITY_DN3614_c0_g1_i1:49-825(+)
MKFKKQKKWRKWITFYKHNFGFKPPYNIIVDSEFMLYCHEIKVNIFKVLPKLMSVRTFIHISKCTAHHAAEAGHDMKFIHVKECGHDEPISDHECIMARLEERQHNYFVFSNDLEFRKRIGRTFAGVATMYMNNNAVAFDQPSTMSRQALKNKQRKMIEGQVKNIAKKVKREERVEQIENNLTKSQLSARHNATRLRKHRAKEPNPLSVKKKKRKPQTPNTGGNNTKEKRKRNRKRKRESAQDEPTTKKAKVEESGEE